MKTRILTAIVMVINQKFFINGFKGLLHKSPNMDTLVTLGSGASFVYSAYVLFKMTADYGNAHHYLHDFYFESAAMILTLITVGKMLEARSKGKTTNALKSLMNLAPKTATILKDGVEVLDVASKQYQAAGDWVGVLFAVQAIGSVLWAIVIPMFKNRKFIYALSLVLGGIGFISTYYIADQYLLFISYALIGCAWAAMLALPFTILTNSLSGKNMGTYLGLFNGTICLPQIIAAMIGGVCVSMLTPAGEIAAQDRMLVLAGILLIIGAISVFIIKETSAERK